MQDTKPKAYAHMSQAEKLAWGKAEGEARKADLAVRTPDGLKAAQANAAARRRAIHATLGQAADLVILANRQARVEAARSAA